MESETDPVTFLLKVDANGRHIYTLQHTGEQYELAEEDDEQEMIEVQDPEVAEMLRIGKRIKLEKPESPPEEQGIVVTEFEETEEEQEEQYEVSEEQECSSSEETSLGNELASMPQTASTSRTSVTKSSVQPKPVRLANLHGVVTQHIDIQEPLSALKNLLEVRFGIKLDDYEFWLQDKHMLESHRTLVDQCVQGEGVVQVNLRIKVVGLSKRINIEDVLKPAEEYPESLEESVEDKDEEAREEATVTENSKPGAVVRWVVDSEFKNVSERLKIPADPMEWTVLQVRHWLQWAVRQFNLVGLKLNDWQMNGQQLHDMTLPEFKAKVKKDPNDLFWTHLELLRKCKFVAVVQKSDYDKILNLDSVAVKSKVPRPQKIPKLTNRLSKVIGVPAVPSDLSHVLNLTSQAGNRTGNNGQVQLWQFLLELLTDKEHRHVIQWLGNEGEFKLMNPEMVAQLWGERKNKPTMNYEKLSRALRYYYDGDMISKVHGKRFVYKYVCDLKQLMGYSPNELNRLCAEAAVHNNIILPVEELGYDGC